MRKILSNFYWTVCIFILLAAFSADGLSQTTKNRSGSSKKTSVAGSQKGKPAKTMAADTRQSAKDPFSPSKFKFIGNFGNGSGSGGATPKVEDEVSKEWLQGIEITSPSSKNDQKVLRQKAFELARQAIIDDGLEVSADSTELIFSVPNFFGSSDIKYLNFEAAESRLQTALRLVPDDMGYYRNGLGVALYLQTKFNRAEVLFRRAIKLNPQEPVFRENLIKTLRFLKKANELETELLTLMRLFPKKDYYRYQLGDFLIDQKRYAEAETILREAVRMEDAGPQENYTNLYRNRLADALFEQKKFFEAEEIYRKALAKETYGSSKIILYKNIAKAQRGRQEFNGAVNILTQLVDKTSGWNKAEVLTELGLTFEEQEKLDEAEKAYQDALQAAPTYTPAKEKLDQLRKKRAP
jgi:tetratricopeptide (TPR) repeat protein